MRDLYALLTSGSTWRFNDTEVPVSGRLRVSSPEAVRDAVMAGVGVGYGPQWLFADGLRSGHLVMLLTENEASPVPIQVLYMANRLLPKRALVYMDYIAAAFAKVPALNVGPESP
ncbi:LysR substrate-binding domain-containing protein [Luteibacter aegosomatissinici]|uniref:LysR substrate-binding domain-containing protein n=1 Tax=Luteibacter aegosomatissinici TaxID=2911539 RepID=UPI0031B82746